MPSGVAGFLDAAKEYKDKDGYVPTESWLQARDRKKQEKKDALEQLLAKVPESCETALAFFLYCYDFLGTRLTLKIDKPAEDPNVRGDAFKTLIVCRLSYQATEEDLEREFGRIGNIERVRFPQARFFPLPKLTASLQIRIVKDTHADEHPNKKKKPHRGYAFIVFEREKDMRGKQTLISPHQAPGADLADRRYPFRDHGPQACPSRPFPCT